MSTEMFESKLTGWFAQSAPTRAPDELLAQSLDATSHARQLPTWRAMLGAPVMRSGTQVLVGSPRLHLARLALLTLLLLAALVGTAVAAALVFHELRPAQRIVFSSREAIGVSPEPTPHWWECGNDPECIAIVTGSGPQPFWIYSVDPEHPDDVVPAASLQAQRGLDPGAPFLSADGRYVALSTPVTTTCSEGLDVIALETGAPQSIENVAFFTWSPDSHSLLLETFQCDESGNSTADSLSIFDAETGTSQTLAYQRERKIGMLDEYLRPIGWLANHRSVLLARYLDCYQPLLCSSHSVEYLKVQLDESGAALSTIQPIVATDVFLPSPDGRRALYWEDGGNTVGVVNLDGSDKHAIASGCVTSPVWSHDSRSIAYYDCAPSDEDDRSPTVRVAEVDGSGSHAVGTARLPDTLNFGTLPRFAPDDSVVYWSDLDGTWTVHTDGSELTKLDLPANVGMDWTFASH